MRFLLFDRITHIEPRRRIEGVKCTTLTEECLRGHYDRQALFPSSLLVEAMVQMLGWLVMTSHDFKRSVVLSVLEDVQLPPDLRPGHRVDLVGELMGTNPKGSMGRATASIDGEQIASIGRVLYGHFDHPDPELLKQRFAYYGGHNPGGRK